MCAGAGAGAVNFQMLGAGAVSAPAPALRGLVQTESVSDSTRKCLRKEVGSSAKVSSNLNCPYGI